MIPFVYYLLKVTFCSGILFVYYCLFLRNRSFHHWNRFYLLGLVPFSLMAPLVRIHIDTSSAYSNNQVVQLLNVTENLRFMETEPEVVSNSLPYTNLLFLVIYCVVSFLFLLGLLRMLLRVRFLLKSHFCQSCGDYNIINTNFTGTPFSFFHYLFWNSQIDPGSRTGRRILQHELAHIQGRHSLDKLFLQIVLIVFWINPIFWLIRKEITMLHEFIADEEAVEKGDLEAFAKMVLVTAYKGSLPSLINPFFHSPIKRRLMMLSSVKSKRNRSLNRLFWLPLPALLVMAFALKPVPSVPPLIPSALKNSFVVVIDAGHGGSDPGAKAANGISEKDLSLAIAKKIQAMNQDRNLLILLTRNGDEAVSLQDRTRFTIQNKAAAFISIHLNAQTADPAESLSGFEVLIPGKNQKAEKNNILLGSLLVDQLKKTYPTSAELKQRKNPGIWVLDSPEINYPAVLIHCGYITSPKDYAFISEEKNQEKIAGDILSAITRFAVADAK